MTKQPLTNALAAIAYIIIVASIMQYAEHHAIPDDKSIFAPVAFISLFTLSAAMMAYIFLSQPLQLYLDGKKKEGVDLFFRTLVIFGGLTAIALIIFFSGVRL